jgi:hypothetical protein
LLSGSSIGQSFSLDEFLLDILDRGWRRRGESTRGVAWSEEDRMLISPNLGEELASLFVEFHDLAAALQDLGSVLEVKVVGDRQPVI